MNPLDIAIVALCAFLALLGLLRGLVRQIAGFAGLILGHLLGVKYGGAVRMALHLDFTYGDIAAYFLTLVAVYVAVRLIGLLVERGVRGTKLSGTDRFLGALAGGAKGVLLSVLLVFFLVVLLPPKAALIKGSALAPRALAAARWMDRIFPERMRESFREKARAVEPGAAPSPQEKNRPRK